MVQAWLNVAGLSLDAVGFLLLLREWWIAFFSERQQLEMALAHERQQKLRTLTASNRSDEHRRHLEAVWRLQDDTAAGTRGERCTRRVPRGGAFSWPPPCSL